MVTQVSKIGHLSTESEAILTLEHQWCDKVRTQDVEWIVNLFSDQGRVHPPGADPVVGTEALRAFWREMAHTAGLSVSWWPTLVHVSTAGDMAYDVGAASTTLPDGRTMAGKYLVVWVRQNGQWKVAVDMFSPNTMP